MASRRAAVLGRPVAHSLSPALHRAAYAELGLDWRYDAIDCGAEQLPDVLKARPDWAGFSCTMPVKQAALAAAGEVSALAALVGAANTLLPRAGGGWRADNTDVTGMLAALAERSVRPASATVLGAGGTAQAAVVALSRLGLERCTVLLRDPGRADAVLHAAARAGIAVEVAALRPQAPALQADLVVSTLPPGAADPLAVREWAPAQALLDAVYDPWPTALGAAVVSAGGRVVGGALMLLHQAAAQVELMTGRAAPVAAMRRALAEAAPGSGRGLETDDH